MLKLLARKKHKKIFRNHQVKHNFSDPFKVYLYQIKINKRNGIYALLIIVVHKEMNINLLSFLYTENT